MMIPAWYGMGTAFEKVCERDREKTLQEMYRQWPFFRALIDNAVLALSKCDMEIARLYAELGKDLTEHQIIWADIEEEYRKTCDWILRVTRQNDLLQNTPWLQRSIRVRNPYVDPLSLIQVQTLRRYRMDEENRETLERILRLTIYGIAAGLRTTG